MKIRSIREKIARFIAPELSKSIDNEINQRTALIISKMDPFEPLLREFHGVFSEEFDHPEENLDERDRIGMMMWGYQQKNDRFFKYMTDWIMNTQGNETLKKAPVTTDRILYGRAQLSTMILFKKEIGRLSSLYEDELAKRHPEGFDENLPIE